MNSRNHYNSSSLITSSQEHTVIWGILGNRFKITKRFPSMIVHIIMYTICERIYNIKAALLRKIHYCLRRNAN